MRLHKIRLAGFKSFVDPTNIPFPGDMTAIVGPNGCGKSNIIDAVRWVLGESSAKNLRGDAMTDVIFNGSSSRNAVSQCSVELVFDNSSKRLGGEFAAYSEISVKRVVTKDAVSSYFLNGTKCRRRDITDLFLGTGLGPRSYAIIEQGMISKLIESKPQELRMFIEEAAGISKYKERRKETQTRIKHTLENLDRLNDVRNELAEQIAKLKRQATAANRYKELKQQERQLKATLATLKWQAQTLIIQDAQAIITQEQLLQKTLEMSSQDDQVQLQIHKNKLSQLKHTLDDFQQQLLAVSTQVTTLEQSQLFAKKRKTLIQAEIEQIMQSEAVLTTDLHSVMAQINETQARRAVAEPEKEMIQEQLAELEDKKDDADSALEAQLRVAKDTQDAFYKQTQLLQQKKSQLDNALSLQARTQITLDELRAEKASISKTTDKSELVELSTSTEKLNQHVKLQEERLNECTIELKQAQAQEVVLRQHFEQQRDAATSLNAKLDALMTLQISTSQNEASLTNLFDMGLERFEKHPPWDYFQVRKEGEEALNSVLQEIGTLWIIDAPLSHTEFQTWTSETWLDATHSLMFAQNFTGHKNAGSLAQLLINHHIPHLLNEYLLADDHAHALRLIKTISPNHKVVTLCGDIYMTDSFIKRQQGDNKIARAAHIKTLQVSYKEAEVAYNEIKADVENAVSNVVHSEYAREAIVSTLADCQQKAQALAIKYNNVLFQHQQSNLQMNKLNDAINHNSQRLAQEEITVETLKAHIEELEEAEELLHQCKREASQKVENLSLQQQQWHAQHAQMQSSFHKNAMLIQQILNSLQILQEQQTNKHRYLEEHKEKLRLLTLEAQELSAPQDSQTETLQMLLFTVQDLRESIASNRNGISKIESDIANIEQNQQSVTTRLNDIKSRVENQRIVLESAKVRASSFADELTQYQQSPEQVLATIAPRVDEASCQQELSSVLLSVNRLGAVNLAAVDEFDECVTRKNHLDTQSLDLTQALDMLESAMRKIDKETRARFKATFEAVNNDLKTLFPKVFGGGMAYLALNDDDMLDTGVTIMARPPGKKNSTIALLSGGEKALTALSLVFAIFRLNPAPFCLLDEVDAPLDDANVGRFCRLVSQMSESVQFIYITHNKIAMEMATHLTGVTMAEPGVSRMVAVDMKQALDIAE